MTEELEEEYEAPKPDPVLSLQSQEFLASMREHPQYSVMLEELSTFARQTVPKWSIKKPMPENVHAYFCGNADGIELLLNFLYGEYTNER